MKWIQDNPVIIGSVIKAALVVGTVFGLSTTEADREAVVAAALTVAAAWVALTTKERASVTPMKKLEDNATDIGGNALKLVQRIKGLID